MRHILSLTATNMSLHTELDLMGVHGYKDVAPMALPEVLGDYASPAGLPETNSHSVGDKVLHVPAGRSPS